MPALRTTRYLTRRGLLVVVTDAHPSGQYAIADCLGCNRSLARPGGYPREDALTWAEQHAKTCTALS